MKIRHISKKIFALCLAALLFIPALPVFASSQQMPSLLQFNSGGGFGLSSYHVTLGKGETYTLRKSAVGTATWTIEDTGIAKVTKTYNNRVTIKGLKAGTTKITITPKTSSYGSQTCLITVLDDVSEYLPKQISLSFVNSRIDYANAHPESTSPNGYKFQLDVDAGLYANSNLEKWIGIIMDRIAKKTGYTYTDTVRLHFINSYAMGHGSTVGNDIYLLGDAAIGNYGNQLHNLVHELLHVILNQNIRNVCAMLSEGFAETYADEVVDSLLSGYPNTFQRPASTEKNNIYLYNFSSQKATSLNFDSMFVTASDSHAAGYYVVRYLRDTYGNSKFKTIMKNSSGKGNAGAMSLIVSSTKSTFKNDLISWFNNLDKTPQPIDYTSTSSIYAKVTSIKWIECFGLAISQTGKIKYKDSLDVDCSKAMGYAQYLGKKCWGVLLSASGSGKIAFYSMKNGTKTTIKTVTLGSQMNAYSVPGATGFTITGSGVKTAQILFSGGMFTTDHSSTQIPGVKVQPETVVSALGKSVRFTTQAADGAGNATYQWQYKDPSSTAVWKNSTTTSGKTNTLKLTAKQEYDGRAYRCRITGENGVVVYTLPAYLVISN